MLTQLQQKVKQGLIIKTVIALTTYFRHDFSPFLSRVNAIKTRMRKPIVIKEVNDYGIDNDTKQKISDI